MDNDEIGAGETAISYADQFAEAAVAKLDGLFGKGFAKENPTAFAAYMAACASNLNSFMMAATSMPDDAFSEMLAALEDIEQDFVAPPSLPARSPKTKGKRSR